MKKKTLVVDDKKSLTRIIKANLERAGDFEVRTENAGNKALAAAHDFRPDLMFLDVMMPDVSGAMRSLRSCARIRYCRTRRWYF